MRGSLKVLKSDKDLMKRIAKKDKAAFSELYERHEMFVKGVTQRYLRGKEQQEDAQQNSWLLVWRKASQYQGSASVTSWLYRIVANCTFLIMRAERRISGCCEPIDSHDFQDKTIVALDTKAILSSELARARRRLNARKVIYGRDCLGLYLIGYESSEMVPILNLSLPAVKSRLHRARKAAFPNWKRAA